MTEFANAGYEVAEVFPRAVVLRAREDLSDHVDRLAAALLLPIGECAPSSPIECRLDEIARHCRSYADLFRRALCTDAHRGERLKELAESPTLREIAERMAGEPLTGSIARVRASIGSFPEHGHPWHSDVSRPDDTGCGRVKVAAWMPLADVSDGDGGLEILPGMRSAPVSRLRTDQFRVEDAVLEGEGPVTPPCPAGSAIFLDRFTPHRTVPTSGDARFALVVWFNTAPQHGVDDGNCSV